MSSVQRISGQPIIFFETVAELRAWFNAYYGTNTEVLVGYYKKGTGIPSITWSESVDAALCFGWIDGVRRSLDKVRYVIRFTPRKGGSNWSAINIGKIKELKRQGLLHPAGLEAYKKRKPEKSAIYSYENQPASFSAIFKQKFRSNKKAWDFFSVQIPSYRRTVTHWVMRAKQESTRERRLQALISNSEAGRWLPQMRYGTNPHDGKMVE
jgi:uncharacterized protein YdeI (YjbR/CyaY-like superfamily)